MEYFDARVLLYLMVLADSHTISKSIYNNDKVDNNIFDSIHDVDRPTNPKTRRERQHKYKLYKEENVAPPDSLKDTKPYGLAKVTDKITLKTVKLTTEHAKHTKTPKRKIGFWKKLRGKDKKKETHKPDPNDRKRRRPNNKKEHKKMHHLATKDSRNPGPKTKGRRKNRKKFSPRQPEVKVSKRDAGTLYSTRPYSSTPQSFKLQTGIAPQFDMLKSKYRMQTDPPFTAVVEAHSEVANNIKGQLESMTSKLSLLQERYGIYGNKPSVKTEIPPEDNAEASGKARCLTSKTQEFVTVPDLDFRLTGQIEALINSMKIRALQMSAYENPVVTDLIKSSVTEASYNYDSHEYGRLNKPGMPVPRNSLSTYVSINDIHTVEKRTPETTKSDEFNLNDSIFSANTESHYIAARSIREDTMTIAQNVEDMLQRELKNLYNKVKHKVSNDLRKDAHTLKSTVKETYSKITGKLSSKCKAAANATSTTASTSTKPTKPKSKTCACKTTTQKKKLKSVVTTTTTLRVKKKDDKDDNKVVIEDKFTPEALYGKTYDDYVMLTLYEQMLAKTHDDNLRKMLATSEYPMYPKIKREAVRLSKRNPETLTDVKLKEVIQSIYDDGSNIPDYDYIDPAANVSSTGKTTAVIYNELDYNEVIDSSDSSDNSAQDPLVESMEVKNKVKGAAPAEVDTTSEAHTSAVDADNAENTASDTSYEGLSNKISYNEFVNGYKHYLKFQKDQGNQNFSNLIKYQAHRHHSVDDIGKYILSKIPPLPPYNKMKREVKFSDDSDNNMDYQEITTKSDDSWFKKHFYLFIDNGPPKKYHTSETVELKPTESKLYITEPTSRIGQTEPLFIKVEPNGVPRKPKGAQGPTNLDDLSKVLDSIKKQQTLSEGNSKTEKDAADEPVIDNMNATDDTIQVKSFIGKLFAGKRRNAPKKDPITMVFFPTTPDYTFVESMQGRLRRSVMKENIESTIMADFINKDIEDKASTGTKELYVDTSQLGNKETNKYGYVDIDLVPRQTAVVKLRDAKKSKLRNFFQKFHFRKKNKKDTKPKRSCYYNSQNRRKERFNPIKRLKAIFSVKEVKEKEEVITEKFPDYDIANTQIEPFKPVKFDKPMSVDEMQKLVPNISDTYFEPPPPEHTTKDTSQLFGLDSKDEDFLSNMHPSSSSIKQSAATHKKTAPPLFPFSNATIVPKVALSSKSQIASITSKPEILRVPSCNVMTVNVKTLGPLPSTTLMATESTPMLTIDDMSLILDNMQDNIQKNQEEFPKLNTMYTPGSHVSQPKFEYKKNIGKPRLHSKNSAPKRLHSKDSVDELVIKGKLTRIAKFPIKKRRYRKKTHDDSVPVIIDQDYSSIDGPSVLEYIHDFGNRNSPYERKKQAKGNSLKKSHHPHLSKPNIKDRERYTDYFNDLLMWHNDILNLDTVPNPQWAKILRTLQSDNSYTTPNMNKLMIELNEINEVMDPGRKLNNTIHIFPNGSLNEGYKGRVGVRALPDESKEQGVVKSLAMQDNTLVTSNDMIIRGEAKYYQYNKPQLQENKVGPSDLVTRLNTMDIDTEESIVPFKWKGGRRSDPTAFENYPEPAIIVDTTLMAYDDDVDSVTKALEPKKQAKNSQKAKHRRNKMETSLKQTKNMISVDTAKNSQRSGKAELMNKMDHPSLLKTNSAPMQYYTTPLPMKSKDFNKFLKENEMDVDFVTSPILDLPTIKEWTNNKNYKQSTIFTSTNIPIQAVEEAPTAKEAKPAMKEAISNVQEAAPPMQEAAPAMQDAAPAMQMPAPPMQGAGPSMQGAAPSMQGAVPPMQEGEAPPMQEAAPAMQGAAPPVQGTAPPLQEIAPPMQEAAPNMQEAAPAMQGAAPAATKDADNSWTTHSIATTTGLTEPTDTKKPIQTEKATKKAGLSKQIKSKVESITKAISKSVKFTSDHPKEKLKEHKPANLSASKPAYWDDDNDRYKRYSDIKLPRNTADPSKATQEVNYYGIFKKKMKEKLFEKKATPTAPVDHPASNPYTDAQNKEVEITIINFDDIENMTSQLPFETFTFPAARKEQIGTYTEFGDLSNIIKNKSQLKTTLKSLDLTQKDEIHNELLYKDIFNEHTSLASIGSTKEFSTKDLTKTTEYVNPIATDDQTFGGDKMRYPFEKMPIYPNILSKVPQRAKNFNSIPKRVHISSHHYKYDIFYDDLKSTGKPTRIEAFQPKLVKITNDLRPTTQSPSPKRTAASEKEAKTSKQVVKYINGTASRYRYRRRVWGSEAPHKKRKHFTFRGCKPKSTGGLTEPTGYFEAVTLSSELDADQGVTGTYLKEAISNAMKNTAKVFKTFQADTVSSTVTDELSKRTDPVTLEKDNTGKSSWPWKSEPLSDIEDVVTMLDQQDDKQEDFENAVTLSAIESEFFTSVTFRDSVRRALPSPSPMTTTTASTTASTTTKATTAKASTRTTTLAAITTTAASTSQPGSLVYDLKKLKPTTSPKPSHKEKPSGPDKDRHRRLFKISSILQNRFRCMMKNLTANTKHSTTETTLQNVTAQSSKDISKRTCIISFDDTTVPPGHETSKGDTETTLEENADVNEGFKYSYTPEHHVADDPDYNEPQSAETPAPEQHPAPAQHPPPASSHHPPETQPQGTVHHHYHHHTAPHPTPPKEPQEEPYTPPPAYHPHYPPPPAYHPHYPPPPEPQGRYEEPYSPPPEYKHTAHHGKGKAGKCKPLPVDHEIQDAVIYFEPETYSDQLYYEHGALKYPPTPTPPPDFHCDYKREAPLNTYTAKDVAALEVIVDLMKNTLNYEDNNVGVAYQRSNTLFEPYTTKAVHPNGSTNAIQVHIAIPCNFPNGKKRSPAVPNPVRVRKVFCAKMSTPVDLEYQVHSFEGTIRPTSTRMSKSTNFTEDALSPGMYLLIDKPRNGYGLKPILGHINLSDLKSRQVAAGTTASMTEAKPTDTREETTSLKSLAKVTLSKDFVAAVNQQLIEMYENISRVNKDVNSRPARSVWKSRKLKEKKEGRKRSVEKYVVKRGIDWDAIRHFFGHDRVCNCKCKSNVAMCRACAASDAVIDELIFEFDNIGRYMADHCTEIQTFFWMNPIGGQRLRESVNKIDKSLTDYYKRVKGKCQGRLCKTFTNYIDKRRITKTYKIKKEDSMSRLMNDLAVLAEDLNRTVSLKVCYNDKLKESGDKFIHLMNSCVMKRKINKRSTPSTTTTTKLVKSVYSLDNINVNIFCNPESSTADEQMFTAAVTGIQDTSQRITDHLLDYDMEETKEPKIKKRKGFKKLFPRKNKKSKLLSYFDFNKKSKTNYKRQVDNRVATPLISDGGGAFWYDYLKAGTNEPRLVRDSINYSPPNIEISVVQKTDTTKKVVTKAPSSNTPVSNIIYMTPVTNAERNQRDIETTDTTTDTLSQNINQMLQLFGSLQDVEAMNNNSNRSIKSSKKVTDKEKPAKESKQKKPSLISKVKQKMTWSKNTTTSACDQKVRSTLKKELNELKTIEHQLEIDSKTITSKNTPHDVTKEILNDNKSVLVNATEPMVINASTLTPPTKVISTAPKASNYSQNAITNSNITNVVRITTVAPKKEDQSETTPTVNKSTTHLGFMNKLKAATHMFGKEEKSQTPERKTETPTTTINATELIMPLNSGVIDIVTDANNKVMDYVIEETTQNATQNPTIVIINEYGNKVNGDTIGDKEEFKNLLLSIIQFETNNLNNEWERVAYAGDRNKNEDDIKRSIVNIPKEATVNPTVTTLMATPTLPTTSLYEDSLPEFETSTKQPEGILDKIVSKMGIKVIKNKKKVVKNASIRQVRKDRKNNFIRNRRLRINSFRSDTPSPAPNREARDSRRAAKSSKICDIQATYEHLKNLQRSIPPKAFEMVAKNISCFKYRNTDPIFVIPYKRQGKRWNWIRNKRSSKLHFYNKDEHNVYDEAFTVNFDDDSNDSFERFSKGVDGIYKIVKRRKRTANLEALELGLRNIPNLTPGEGELYVMAGDTVTMDCGLHTPVRTCDGKFLWKTDRNRMLKQDNVYVDDVSLVINNVEPKNVGTYTCSLDHTVRKNVKLNVLTIPSFDIVFLPVYKTQDNCSYDDLKAIQRLGTLMANEIHCGKSCSVRIDEPVCQRDKGTNSTLVRVAAVISVTPRPLNCSLQCKRDIVSSLVMLCATNTAALSSIRVLVSKDGVNETLTPWKDLVRPVVTHTLRKKDTNGHHEYHKLMSLLSPGKVDVVLICPAGYYLLPKFKLCSSCPPNTSSKTGDNTCRSCPRGTRAEPGAAKCHLVQTHPRRYDWWWYPPCGYVVACCGVLFGCTACMLLSLIVHLLSRDAELKEREGHGDQEGQKTPQTMRRVTVAYAHIPATRPLSPSRVILPRFFRPSPASSRATDSQETKFELWKERNRPPPLPPIDFDP